MSLEPTLADLERTTGDDEDTGGFSFAAGASIGRYLILSHVGAGNMGVVLAAYDPQLDRKVAVKLLRGDEQGEAARTRLQREAQALARLGHPNVVAIHDVGEYEGRVYLVMEFIAGEDVRSWQRRRPSWREVVRVYLQAGHGLAAAHNAGLVHRDFKPANVMISGEGRVRVMDFGLARAAPDALPGAIAATPVERPHPKTEPMLPAVVRLRSRRWLDRKRGNTRRAEAKPETDALSSEVTRAGAVVGTPAYMAPEQIGGLPADARSDQFAFCVAFYEALYGHRPFAGNSVAMLLTAIGDGDVRPAPRSSRVPGWLRAALLRGLHMDPAQRWPSMDALLEVIERTPVRRRRWEAIAITAALTAGGATVGLMQSRDEAIPAEVCSGAEDKLTEVWSATDRERMRIAFASSGRPYAQDTLARVEQELDAYGGAWTEMYVDACEATHLRWEQSETVLDQRMRCLERSRRELGALVEALVGAGADPDIVERAVGAIEELPRIERCADVETIASELPLPDDQRTRARVDEIRNELADAGALDRTGQVEAAEALAEELLVEAEALGYGPLTAEVEFLLGRLARQGGAFDRGRELLESAYFRALGEEYSRLASEVAIELIYLFGQELVDTERGHDWVRHAQALVRARGDDPLARARIERFRVALLVEEGRYEDALVAGRAALEVVEARAGADSPDAAAIHNNLGATLVELGRWSEAEIHLRRGAELMELQLGPEHPKVAIMLGNLGAAQLATGRTQDAIATYDRAIQTLTRTYGHEHPALGALHINLGLARQIEGHDKAALRELDEAQRVLESQLGATHPKVAAALQAKAEVELGLGHVAKAEEAARRALFVFESNFDAAHPDVARARVELARALLAAGLHDETQAELDRALAVLEAPEPADTMSLAAALQVQGELLLARGELANARAQLERAQTWWEGSEASAERTRGLASTRLALARALVELDEPEQATALAQRALAELEDEGSDARVRRIARRLRRFL